MSASSRSMRSHMVLKKNRFVLKWFVLTSDELTWFDEVNDGLQRCMNEGRTDQTVQVDGDAVERLAMTAITDITRTEASVIVIKHGHKEVLDVDIITNKQDQSHMDACRQWHQVNGTGASIGVGDDHSLLGLVRNVGS